MTHCITRFSWWTGGGRQPTVHQEDLVQQELLLLNEVLLIDWGRFPLAVLNDAGLVRLRGLLHELIPPSPSSPATVSCTNQSCIDTDTDSSLATAAVTPCPTPQSHFFAPTTQGADQS